MLIAIRIDVVVVVIDRVDESPAFVHFVGMPIAPCFKGKLLQWPPTPFQVYIPALYLVEQVNLCAFTNVPLALGKERIHHVIYVGSGYPCPRSAYW